MQRAGLDPERLQPQSALDEDALAQAREDSAMAGVLPVLRRYLGALAEDAQHVLVVCDEAGRILWLEGHERVKEDAVERIRFSEGMLWTEDSVGHERDRDRAGDRPRRPGLLGRALPGRAARLVVLGGADP